MNHASLRCFEIPLFPTAPYHFHPSDLLGMSYSVTYSLNNRLYCTKWAHLHLLFGQLLPGMKISNNELSIHFSRWHGLNSLCNS